jgi:alkylhydroperoxidase/carboxymuconolactone decarboxylase family protein YurZ
VSEPKLRGWTDATVADAYARLFTDDGVVPGLDARDQALILVGLHAVHGDETATLHHGRKALAAGAPSRAVVEVVLAAAISRGGQALRRSRQLLSELGAAPWSPGDEPPRTARQYLAAEFGEAPAWARHLEAFAPDALAAYTAIRQRILTDGAAPRWVKELVTMVLNAIDGNAGGTRSHAAAALRHGADRPAVLGALLLGVRVGGIVTWINGVGAVGDLVALPSHG